jgi:hypothetical protein
MTTAYTTPVVVQPKYVGGPNPVSMTRTICGSRWGAEPAGRVDSVATMTTAAGEFATGRIATIREQLKLLGDYL